MNKTHWITYGFVESSIGILLCWWWCTFVCVFMFLCCTVYIGCSSEKCGVFVCFAVFDNWPLLQSHSQYLVKYFKTGFLQANKSHRCSTGTWIVVQNVEENLYIWNYLYGYNRGGGVVVRERRSCKYFAAWTPLWQIALATGGTLTLKHWPAISLFSGPNYPQTRDLASKEHHTWSYAKFV